MDLQSLSPLALAFVGDAVFTLFIRRLLVEEKSRNPRELQREASRWENAAAQSSILERLEPGLTQDEKDMIRRGRNASPGTYPRGASPADYHRATALETLIGYLYLQGNNQRLEEILTLIADIISNGG